MNNTEIIIPQTPETMFTWIIAIFAILFFCLICYAIWKAVS